MMSPHDERGPGGRPHPPPGGGPSDGKPPDGGPPHSGPPGDGPTSGREESYLFVVSYRDDAERKRVEYAFNTWDGGSIEAPDGLVRIARAVDVEALYRELLRKLPEERVTAYELGPVRPDLVPETAVVERTIPADNDAVESFLRYAISKKKGSATDESNAYDVYTNKGRADVTYELTAGDGETAVELHVSGHAAAPDYLAAFFERELDAFAASQRQDRSRSQNRDQEQGRDRDRNQDRDQDRDREGHDRNQS